MPSSNPPRARWPGRRICGQSATATLTSSKYPAEVRLRTSASRSGSATRSTSMRCQDSARALDHLDRNRRSVLARPAARAARGAPSGGSRDRCRSCHGQRVDDKLGMSSVTTSTTVRGVDQPSRSVRGIPLRTIGWPRRRLRPSSRWLIAAMASVSGARLPQVVLVDAAVVESTKATSAFGGNTLRCPRARSAVASIRCCRRRRDRSCHRGLPVVFDGRPGAGLYRARLEFACELTGALGEPGRTRSSWPAPPALVRRSSACSYCSASRRDPAVHRCALGGDLQHRPSTVGPRLRASQSAVAKQAGDCGLPRPHPSACAPPLARGQTRIPGQHGKNTRLRDAEARSAAGRRLRSMCSPHSTGSRGGREGSARDVWVWRVRAASGGRAYNCNRISPRVAGRGIRRTAFRSAGSRCVRTPGPGARRDTAGRWRRQRTGSASRRDRRIRRPAR